jgi:DNA-binding response OmpR family regulator
MTEKKQIILIVDDDMDLLMLFSAELAQEYQMLTAQTGEEGLIMALLHKPSIVISDINMPELNGWEFCYLMRQIPTTRAIPFVFLSSRSDLPDKIKGLRLGADDFISKPFSLSDVAHRIRVVLGRVKNRQRVLEGLAPYEMEINTLLIDLLEYLRATRRSGVIEFSNMDQKGSIALSGGNIVETQFEDTHGEEALRTMLQLGSGEILFKEKQIDRDTPIIHDWTSFIASFLPPE